MAVVGLALLAVEFGTVTIAWSNPGVDHFSVSATSPQDAGVQFNVTVTALDASNQPVMDYTGTVHLTSSDSAATLPADYTFSSGDNGTANISGVILKTSGKQTVTATDTSNNQVIGTSSDVWVNGPVDPSNSTLSASPTVVPADDSTESKITATLKDAGGLPVVGKSVQLRHDGQPNCCSGGGATDANGVVTFGASDANAEKVTFTAAVGDVIVAQTATVSYVDVDPRLSTISANPTSVTADGTQTSTITVTLKKASNGSPVTGATITLDQGNGHSTIVATSPTTDQSGVATFTVSNTHAETDTYTATDTTDAITLKSTATVTFTPGSVSPSTSTLTASTNSVPADGTTSSTLTVTLTDAYGNAVSDRSVTLTGSNGSSLTGTTDRNGQAQFTVTDPTPERVTYSAKDTTDGVAVFQTQTITFYGPGDAAQSYLNTSANAIRADGKSSATITVVVRDRNAAPVPNKSVTLHAGSGSSTITGTPGTTDANGQVAFTVTDGTSEQVTYTATDTTDDVAVNQPIIIQFISTAASHLVLTGTPNSVIAGHPASVTVTAENYFGDVVTSYTGTIRFSSSDAKANLPADYVFTPADAGVHTFTNAYTLNTVGNQHLTATDTSDSSISGSSAFVTVAPPPQFTQCPAVGESTGCAVLIKVTNFGIQVLGDPNVRPFDGSEDTLVGVENDSSSTVDKVTLAGGDVSIFGFEADGVCGGDLNPEPACNWPHPTTYEGPNTAFANINQNRTAGEVLFPSGLAPGASTYFSLEEPLQAATITAINLTPSTATNPVATSHTVVAALTKGGSPVVGAKVSFSVGGASAPDGGTTGTATTDAKGTTSFTYTNNGKPGTDTITASFTDSNNVTYTATATKTWVAIVAHSISGKVLTPGDGFQPVAGATVTACRLGGGKQCAAPRVSASDGGYSFTGLTPGNWTVQATPPTTSGLQPKGVKVQLGSSDVTQDIVLDRSAPDLQVTVSVTPSSSTVGSPVTFTYHLRNDGNAAATFVGLTVTPPANSTLVSVTATPILEFDLRRLAATLSPECTSIGSGVLCSLGTVPAGGGSDVAMIVTPNAPGPLTSTGEANSAETTADPQAASITVAGPAAPVTPPSSPTPAPPTPTPTPPPPTPATGPPQPGKFNAQTTGTVFVDGAPVSANQVFLLDSGAIVDVTNGSIAITGSDGRTGVFSAAEPARTLSGLGARRQTSGVVSIFQITQPAIPTAVTTLTLVGGDFSVCKSTRALSSVAGTKKKPVRSLWGKAKGKFRTRAKYSSATVRGTVWLTQDRCDGSYTFVREDVVDVFDFTLKKTFTLRPGQSHLAKPPAKAASPKTKKKKR